MIGANTELGNRDIQYQVSIHAPVIGAKQAIITYLEAINVSIHAPVIGAKRRHIDIL